MGVSTFPFVSKFVLGICFRGRIANFASTSSQVSFSFGSSEFAKFGAYQGVSFMVLSTAITTLRTSGLLATGDDFVGTSDGLYVGVLAFATMEATGATDSVTSRSTGAASIGSATARATTSGAAK